MSRSLPTRTPLVALACLLLLAPSTTTGMALEEGADAQPVPLRLDVTGLIDPSELTTIPAHAPVPADAPGMGPGSLLVITMPGGTFLCTANFLWTDQNGKWYLGSAGHCFLPSNKQATHGPGADYDPSLTKVRVCVELCSIGSNLPDFRSATVLDLGPVAYARQTQNGRDVGNDFGIVEIPAAALARVRPSMPVFLGPTATGELTLGAPVCHYGNGFALGAVYPTRGRVGSGVGSSRVSGSWTALVAIAGGDSGSAIQTCAKDDTGIHGVAAIGIVTHAIGTPGVTIGLGVGYGTTVAKAKDMATQAGLTIAPVLSTV